MPRFYLNTNITVNQIIELSLIISRHIMVLRLHVGDLIEIFNGNNYAYHAQIITINKKSIIIKVIEVITNSTIIQKIKIHLVFALIDGDKIDLIMQKAVELGVSSITPIITTRTQNIKINKYTNKLQRWQNIIYSSCEQSQQNIIPILHPIINFNHYIVQDNIDYLNCIKFILDPMSDNIIQHQISSIVPQNIIVMIGPEGGFTNDEIVLANKNNFTNVQLGQLILRAETAIISSIVAINIIYGNWLNKNALD